MNHRTPVACTAITLAVMAAAATAAAAGIAVADVGWRYWRASGGVIHRPT